jgi:hypothetical protein
VARTRDQVKGERWKVKGEELKDERWRVEGKVEGEKDTAVDSLCEWSWVGKSKVSLPNQEGTTSPTIARCDSILSTATVSRCWRHSSSDFIQAGRALPTYLLGYSSMEIKRAASI